MFNRSGSFKPFSAFNVFNVFNITGLEKWPSEMSENYSYEIKIESKITKNPSKMR
jgi:hypothetical protein